LRQLRGIKWATCEEDVLAAWIADMDFPVAEPIRAAIAETLERSDLGYPVKPEQDDIAHVFCQRMEHRFGWQPAPDRVEVLTDVVQGLFIALDTLCGPDRGVVIQTPIYPPFLQAAEQCRRRVVLNPLVRTGQGYEIDFDRLSSRLHDVDVLMLCNPHNPTGRVFTREELERLAGLVLAHNLVVLSDEIHADLVYAGHSHIPFASLAPEVAKRTVTFYSANKTFNTAGIRCAVAAFGSDHLQAQFNRVPLRVRGGLCTFAMAATRAAWQECGDWQRQVLTYLEANRDEVSRFVAAHLPEADYHPPQATYLAWLAFSPGSLQPSPCAWLRHHARVALMDGAPFGLGFEHCARLNFATPRPLLDQILHRIQTALSA